MQIRKALYVRNCISNVTHQIVLEGDDIDPAEWQTNCGWNYYFGEYTKQEGLPSHWKNICGVRLPLERKST